MRKLIWGLVIIGMMGIALNCSSSKSSQGPASGPAGDPAAGGEHPAGGEHEHPAGGEHEHPASPDAGVQP